MGELKYRKIYSLGHRDTAGINSPNAIIEITEKLDGANMRVRLVKDTLWVGSRNNWHAITSSCGVTCTFNSGMDGWVKANWDALYEWLSAHPGKMLIGEFMSRHTIFYGHKDPFYIVYDVMDTETETYLSPADRVLALQDYRGRINTTLYVGPPLPPAELDKLMRGKSILNDHVDREGIVLKSSNGIYAKLVQEKFKEELEQKFKPKTFVDYQAPHYLARDRFVTEARVRKIYNKFEELGHERTGGMQDMKWMPLEVWKDIEEECTTQINEDYPEFDWDAFRKLVTAQTAGHLKRITTENGLNGN